MLNATAIGNLGKDAVLRHVNGKSVVSFSIAHNERYVDQDGVINERTTWIDCSFWRNDDAKVSNFLKKGQLVYVEGTPSAAGYRPKDSNEIRGALRLKVRKLDLLGSIDKEDEEASKPEQTAPEKAAKPKVTLETVGDPTEAWD